jgi:alkanesulfonate monooxygenase SsuD/methylene tetrahydromethanopterin reductase-like flavin-dependent oxidoreductase (luciferase family)
MCWRGPAELARRMDLLRSGSGVFAPLSTEHILNFFRTNMGGVLGSPDEVIVQLRAYAAAGVEEVMIQWFGMDDIEGLAALAHQVLPHFSS